MLGLWKVREIADKVTNVVMNYTEIEAKVREATNDEAWGPTGNLMQEIAQSTFTYEQFPEVMGMLWKRMLGERKNWRRTYKSLLLLNYLIRNGSERVVTSSREHLYDLRGLENYTCVDELGKDQGINIRHKVKELIEFVQDDDKLREERKKAKKNKDKYVGMSNDALGLGSGRGGGGSWDDTPRWKKQSDFSDWDSNQGNRSSSTQKPDDDSDLSSADEAEKQGSQANRSTSFEYRDTDDFGSGEARQEKEFRFGKEKPSSLSSNKISKKIDLGAAAFYKGDNRPVPPPSPPPSAAGQSSANGSVDLLGDVFSSPVTSQPAGSNSQPAANALFDDFDPRSSESGANGDFGDFSSAFSTGTTAPAMLSSGSNDNFANFGAVFESGAVSTAPAVADLATAPAAPPTTSNSLLLDDLFSSGPPSMPTNSSFATGQVFSGPMVQQQQQPMSMPPLDYGAPMMPMMAATPLSMNKGMPGNFGPMGSTWSNVGGLDINIDNLSLAAKQRTGNAPSMNQLGGAGPVSPGFGVMAGAPPPPMNPMSPRYAMGTGAFPTPPTFNSAFGK